MSSTSVNAIVEAANAANSALSAMAIAMRSLAVILVTIASAFSLHYSRRSIREVRGRKPSIISAVLFILLHFLIIGSIIAKSPWAAAVLLLAIGAFGYFNQEGSDRAASWTALSIGYALGGVLAIAGQLDEARNYKPQLVDFTALIVLAIFFIACSVAIRLGRDNGEDDLPEEQPEEATDDDKEDIASTVIFAVTVVLLIAAIAAIAALAF